MIRNTYVEIFLLWLYILCHSVVQGKWTISAELNPGCMIQCEDKRLIYLRATNESTSVHTFIDASRSAPSVLTVHSSVPNASANIDWSQFNKSVPTEMIQIPSMTQSYAMMFLSVLDYDDNKDTADMSTASKNASAFTYLSSLDWTLYSSLTTKKSYPINGEIFEVTFVGNSSDSIFARAGSVQIRFMMTSEQQRNTQLPALLFVPGLSFQFEFVLTGLVSRFDSGRFGLQLVLFSNTSLFNDEDYSQTSVFSIDDEITPGIFEMINVKLGEVQKSNTESSLIRSRPGAFLQTRPICYALNDSHHIKDSRDVKVAPHRNISTTRQRSRFRFTLPFFFYGPRYEQQFHNIPTRQWWTKRSDALAPIGIRVQNISFGTSGDHFYNATNYLAWTASFGFGEPPRDRMSSLLIGLISFSVCVILASLIFGSLVLIVLRRRRSGTHLTSFAPLRESMDAISEAAV